MVTNSIGLIEYFSDPLNTYLKLEGLYIMGAVDNVIQGLITEKIEKLEQILESDIFHYYGRLDDEVMQPFISMMDDLSEDDNKRDKLSVILTTRGGSALAVERMVNIIRHHYDTVDFYVPEYAYSAGTIFCMSGDSIHMTYASVLGPIDPQVKSKDGNWVPALGYLDKINELIAKEKANILSPVEILFLRDFDLAELHTYEQARDLTVDLLKKWLVNYKFKTWTTHRSNGQPVSLEEKNKRAESIAKELGNNQRWLSHSRPIGLEQLQNLKLLIDDYGQNKPLKNTLDEFYRLSKDYIIKNGVIICMQTRLGGAMK